MSYLLSDHLSGSGPFVKDTYLTRHHHCNNFAVILTTSAPLYTSIPTAHARHFGFRWVRWTSGLNSVFGISAKSCVISYGRVFLTLDQMILYARRDFLPCSALILNISSWMEPFECCRVRFFKLFIWIGVFRYCRCDWMFSDLVAFWSSDLLSR